MKIKKTIYTLHSIVFTVILAAISVGILTAFVPENSVFADDDWAPQLNPTAPVRLKYIEELDTVDDEPEGLPRRIAARSESLPMLPPQPKKRTIKPVQFSSTLEPQETILPSRFLEEDASAADSVPKPIKKSVADSVRKSVETGAAVSPLPARTPAGNVYYEGEYIVNSDTGGLFGGNPALAGGYMGEPIVYPFGTGWLDNFTLFAGTRGFKSEMDAYNTGNFGFDEGFNWSVPVSVAHCVSAQLGFRAAQSNIRGNQEYEKTDKRSRSQYFGTAGLFYRDLCSSYQGGAVFDFYHDDFYEKLELFQARVELSIRTFSNTEYGFQGSFGLNNSSNEYIRLRENGFRGTIDVPYSIFSDNSYQLFVRHHTFSGGVVEGRIGATEHGAFVLSGAGEFPLCDSLAIKGGFRLMIPKGARYNNEGFVGGLNNPYNGGRRQESWDVSFGLVYYFRGGALTKVCNPCRPMFDVADTGSYFNRVVVKQ
ncbi:MAG: hypothetical protein FWE67_06550 [Planctomycetaceae bacterium]|nr:hypothetical protein [Planctomycetaceae bacterium]